MRLLGTPRLTWRRLDVFVQQSAADPASALWRDMADRPYLGLEVAVASEHTLRVLAWQKTADGHATPPRNFPQPLTAPQDRSPRGSAITPKQLAAFRNRTQGGE